MPEWAWPALLCLAPALLPDSLQAGLEYRRDAVLEGELWRLVSGHWVHHSWRHAALDGGALALLASLTERAGGGRLLARLILAGLPISLVLLMTVPDMAVYRGASGLALFLAGILVATLWRTRPEWRPGLLLACAAVAAKAVADAYGLSLDLTGLPPGVRVAWQAHLAGFALGGLLGCLPDRSAR